MLLSLLITAHAATPFFGVSLRPLSRADLVWVADDRITGTSTGEFDGVVKPNLGAYFGVWVSDRVAILGSLGVARLQNTTWSEDIYRQRHWGVVRPGVDLRWSPFNVRDGLPIPWIVLGGYGDVPSARDTSNGFTKEEQRTADTSAKSERARLGGVGGRLGFGAELRISPAVAVGAQAAFVLHRAVLETDDTTAVSSWFSTDALLFAELRWPGQSSASP